MYVILIYDVCLEEKGQRNLRKVFKICKKYLTHIQNSVFEGELSDSQLVELKYELSPHIRPDLDSVILFKSRRQRWLAKEFWGLTEDPTDNSLWLSTPDAASRRADRRRLPRPTKRAPPL